MRADNPNWELSGALYPPFSWIWPFNYIMLFKDCYWEKVEIGEGRERKGKTYKNLKLLNSIYMLPLLVFFEWEEELCSNQLLR